MKLFKLIISLILFIAANNAGAQETVLLRTDRDIYIAGESVWFEASCLKSGTSIPSDLSQVLYIELLNQENVPVMQLKLLLENGTVSTRLELSDTLSTGNYLIRAYTKWMRNYNVDLFFTKTIAILNPFTKNQFPKRDHIFSSDTLFFYPEGGKTMINHSNRILVQSFDKYGSPVSVSGEIISPSGSSVLNIGVKENGIHCIEIQPEEKGIYRFRFNSNDNKQPIPAFTVSDKGYNLQLKNGEGDKPVLHVLVEGIDEIKPGQLDIISSNGSLLKSFIVPLSENTFVTLDPGEFPSGYLCVLLSNAEEEVLASRYFIASEPEEEYPIKISTDKSQYSERSEVSVHIENPGQLSQVSVSVVKDCLLNYKTKIGNTSLPDHLPFQVFMESISNGISANDLLIPFIPVKQIRSVPDQITFLPEMKGEIISGTVVNPDNQEPLQNRVFLLNFVGKTPTIKFSETDSTGRFFFEANLYGEQEMVIQPFSRDTMDLNYKVNLDIPFCTNYSTPAQPLYFETEKITEINKAIINMQISALYKSELSFSSQLKVTPEPVSFYGKPEISIVLENYIELPTMEEIFREIVPNVHPVKNEEKFEIIISENNFPENREVNSFCMVDGVPVFNQNNIFKIEPQKTERIDVLKTDFYMQNYKLGKIMNLTTKKGDMSAFDFDKRIFRQSYQMYTPEYLFNSPDYSVDSIKKSRIPDFRNVLYWTPDISFNEVSNADFSFYTSDETSRYIIIVEGVNKEGILQRKQYPIEVTREL